jgi:tetratricopeptide (TPR) repeat protein
MTSNKNKNLLIFLSLILFNLVIYFNGIGNEFVWDDSYLAEENYHIRDAGNIKDLLTMEDKPATFSGRGYFRPLINLTYLSDYLLYGGKPYGFRLTNIAFHIACVIMLFLLVQLITGSRLISLMTAIIFSAQAVHVEAVTLVSGRNNVICTLFVLFSVYFYIRSSRYVSASSFFLSMVFLFLGAASKEFAFVVPFIFVLYDYNYTRSFSISRNIDKYAISVLVLTLFMVYRALTVPMQGAFRFNLSTMYIRVINTFQVFVNYIRSQIIPDSLSIYFDLPLKDSLFSLPILTSFIVLAALFMLVIYFKRSDKALFFSFFAYFILLLPVSNIIEIPGSIMADRWLYPASCFFALFLSRLIFLIASKWKELVPIITISFALFLTYFTIERNHVFKTDYSLFLDTVETFPESAMARNNLGTELKKMGRVKEAEEQYLYAIESNPEYNLPYNNLGVLCGERKEHERALEYFKKAYDLNPRYALTPFNMGITYDDLGNIKESSLYYEIALSLNPQHFDSYYNLAANYYGQQKYEETIKVLKRALKHTYDEEKKKTLTDKIKMVTGVIEAQKTPDNN